MRLENIILFGICIIAIAIIGYFSYLQNKNQNEQINGLYNKFEEIEKYFLKPPPTENIQSIYRTTSLNCGNCEVEAFKLDDEILHEEIVVESEMLAESKMLNNSRTKMEKITEVFDEDEHL